MAPARVESYRRTAPSEKSAYAVASTVPGFTNVMRSCGACGHHAFLEAQSCTNCGRALAFHWPSLSFVVLPEGDEPTVELDGQTWTPCARWDWDCNWLAGDDFSLADIAAAAHISCVDYLGDVPWSDYPGAHDWYARVKSRPSFRPLLADHIPGLPPPKHYADLDF